MERPRYERLDSEPEREPGVWGSYEKFACAWIFLNVGVIVGMAIQAWVL